MAFVVLDQGRAWMTSCYLPSKTLTLREVVTLRQQAVDYFHNLARAHGSQAHWVPEGGFVAGEEEELKEGYPYTAWRDEALRESGHRLLTEDNNE